MRTSFGVLIFILYLCRRKFINKQNLRSKIMGNLSIWVFFIGAFIACRSLSFAAIQLEMFGLRKSMCIKRIVHEQRACDALISVYHILVVLIGFWMMILGGWEVFRECTPPEVLGIMCPLMLVILFIGYFALRIYVGAGYDLSDFYDDMVAYRKKQEVVTKDNDNEVSFIRSYKRVKKHFWYALIWTGLLIIGMLIMKWILY